MALVAAIDRSEHVEVEYRVIDGQLQQVPAVITDVPAWDPTGSGPHTVAAEIAFCSSVVARGGILLGAFDGERTAGLAIVHPAFEPRLAWLAFLHVSRPYRRRGAAQALWNAAADIAVAADAESIYVSATPTASAVGFYLRQALSPGASGSPGPVRRGAGRHSSRSITEVIAELGASLPTASRRERLSA